LRHVRKRARNWRLLLILVRPSIREALAFDAFQSKCRTLYVANADARTIGIAERKFVQITLQMLFAAVNVGSAHPAFEHAEKVFDVVGVDLLVCSFPPGNV
jgi:hypothetical protein